MKKLEGFLYDFAWLWKLGIVLIIIFWSTQANIVIMRMYDESKEKQAKYLSENHLERAIAVHELEKFIRQVLHEASAKSRKGNLSAREYFEDLKKIRLKNRTLYYRSLNEDLRMRRLDYSRSLSRIYRPSELYRNNHDDAYAAAVAYEEWVKAADIHQEDGDKMLSSEPIPITWPQIKKVLCSIGEWFLIFYRRSFILIILLYLARMMQRKGVLATILADKKRFVLALIFWPVLVGKYPYNVIREIIVEAELRRLGSVFRRLAPKERLEVQAIANSDKYYDWLKNFRTENRLSFQRSFWLTLVVTPTLHALSPALAASSETNWARGDPPILLQVTGNMVMDDCPNSDVVSDECLPEPSFVLKLYVSEKLELISEKVKQWKRSKKIDRIPISQLFGCGVLILN